MCKIGCCVGCREIPTGGSCATWEQFEIVGTMQKGYVKQVCQYTKKLHYTNPV